MTAMSEDHIELRKHLLWFLESRLLTEEELAKWADLINLLDQKQCIELFDLLYKEVEECDERTIENVQAYLLFLERIRSRREDLLTTLGSDGSLRAAVDALMSVQTPEAGSLDTQFESDEEFATYLATLPVLTLELYKEQIQGDSSLSDDAKSTLLTLLTEVQKENFEGEKESAQKLRALSQGIAEAVLIQNMITKLEALSR
tara:strand:+ start:189 stop:794 length:606 start_codon:yes stop_codon:yes gene_type:complete